MKEKNISNLIFEHAEIQKDKTKIGERVYNWLQRDFLRGIILSGDVFWIEPCDMPNYVYDYIVKFYKKKGYKYLYEISK